MGDAVLLERQGSVATITLNRPEQFNVMNTELSMGLRQSLQDCADDPDVRAIILTGNGKAFSGGGDIKFFVSELQTRTIGPSFEKMMPMLHAAIYLVREMQKPVVAALNGVAAGGGLGLALACDFRVMSAKANLGDRISWYWCQSRLQLNVFLASFCWHGKGDRTVYAQHTGLVRGSAQYGFSDCCCVARESAGRGNDVGP